MAFAEIFVSENPHFFKGTPEGFDLWEQVNLQAIDHTQKSDHSRLLEKQRPNEPPEIHTYRKDNVRNITRSTVVRFSDKTMRIFKLSGISFVKGQISDALREWVASENCRYLNQSVNFEEYAYRCLWLLAIEDPNGAAIMFPLNPINPALAPSVSPDQDPEGMPDTMRPDIEPRVVPYSKIAFWSDDMFAYVADTKWPYDHNGREKNGAWYWIADNEYWYQYVPIGVNAKNKVVYDLRKWFKHDTGLGDTNVLPVAKMPGRIKTKSEDGEMIKYHESILSPSFEFLDEGAANFSDTQGLRIRYQHPITIYSNLPCLECKGTKTLHYEDPKTGKRELRECDSCRGTGKASDPGIHGKFVTGSTGIDKDAVPGVSIVTPPQEPLRDCYQMTFDLLQRGNRVIGLDLVTNEVESGEAKRRRLEDLADMLASVGPMFFDFIGRLLFYAESLLESKRSERRRPIIKLPVTYDTRDLEILKEDAQNALSSDKVESQLTYFQRKYQNNPVLVRVYELALDYSPLLAYELEDRVRLAGAGAYNDNDLIKADRAVWAFKRIAESMEPDDFMMLISEDAKPLIDALIAPFLPQPQTALFSNTEA